MWPLSCVRPELVITMLCVTLSEGSEVKWQNPYRRTNNDTLWVETKKMLSGKKPSINSVDGACNPEAISEVFASKYETLFQGTPTDPVKLQSVYRTIKSGVTAS